MKVDEAYVCESILNPQAKIVAGYRPLMPTFAGQIGEEELLQLKKKLRDEQALLLELELKDARPALKKKPTIEFKPTLKEKPLKEKPDDQ